ncbi:hypothetical protein ACYEXS_05675 [Paenibacillus sp. MAH-36]|uniref:DUF3052 domain-containing protein n=1 Tax=Paenibacillus violae TaxID=3077234 RepID=A0ABU3REG0_9BACL|nr:hypothetical protein [Paenibacillus sp. PFR10]MDU0202665.1 hypothetical protein [Paenibacillus sp. PFR10]
MQEALLKKLHYKQGRALVLHAPEGYALGIEEPGEPNGSYDFVQLFVKDAAEVEEWTPKAMQYLKDDALFWITYPKQSSKVKTNINRDSLFTLVSSISEYRAVSNVAVDETWSALRFRHLDKVKSKG